MYGYIYITTNKINGKIYIGQKKGDYNESYFGSGVALNKSIIKYGIENFENHVIEWCDTKDILNERERFWIKKYNSFLSLGNGYNISEGGDFGDITCGMTDDQIKSWKEKMSKSRVGNKNCVNRKLSEETKNKIRESRKNLTEENRKNISNAQKGKKISASQKEGMIKANLKETKIVYKGKEYLFKGKGEALDYFSNNFSINLYSYFRFGKFLKSQSYLEKDITFIQVKDKIIKAN